MMTGTRPKWLLIGAGALAVLASAANSQTCDTLLGGVNCSRPGASSQTQAERQSDWSFGSPPGNPGLGTDLLTGRSDDDTAMLGGIVFGGSGATCMGPFRWRKC